jgi:molybdopterin molybdotransferase
LTPPTRVSVGRAIAWIDAATNCLDIEKIGLETATGRVLAADIRAANPIPAVDRTAIDGYALHAEDSLGAGAYNPLALTAIAVEAGEALPAGADAVVPRDEVETDEAGRVVLVEPVVSGANIERAGAAAGVGVLLVAAHTGLAPRHIGMLAVAGRVTVPVFHRPRVRLAIAGRARSSAGLDGNGPMLRALIERDGGIVIAAALVDAFAGGADFVIVAGGTGRGHLDRSAAALAASGRVDIHGVALAPGETAGFGHTADQVPVVLLPGAPAACLWNYELFAGRAIRRLGGNDPTLPYAFARVVTARKIVSPIGVTEIRPIRRLADGRVEPLGAFGETEMMAGLAGDGFIIVPEAREGYPAGAQLTAFLYDQGRTGAEPVL